MYKKITNSLNHIVDNLSLSNIKAFLPNLNFNSNNLNIQSNLHKYINFLKPESHKYIEMAIVLEGASIIQIDSNYYTLSKKQICIIDKNVEHRLGWLDSSQDCSSILWISITGETIRTSFSTYTQSGRQKISGIDIYTEGEFLMNEICCELREKKDGYVKAIFIYISAFLTLLIRNFKLPVKETMIPWNTQIVDEIKNYIRNHLDSHITLQEISNKVYLSPNYISTLFRQVTGQTITQYILDNKIRHAALLLSNNELTLSEIAAKLGFYDQFHFSKVFKSFTGQSPTKYRKSIT